MTGDFQTEDLIFMMKKISLNMEVQLKRCLDRREREQLWHLEQKMLRQTAAEQKTEKEKNRRLQHEDSLSTTKAV